MLGSFREAYLRWGGGSGGYYCTSSSFIFVLMFTHSGAGLFILIIDVIVYRKGRLIFCECSAAIKPDYNLSRGWKRRAPLAGAVGGAGIRTILFRRSC